MKTRITILTLAHAVGTLHIVSVMVMTPVIQGGLSLGVTQVGPLATVYYAAQPFGALMGIATLAVALWFRGQRMEETPR